MTETAGKEPVVSLHGRERLYDIFHVISSCVLFFLFFFFVLNEKLNNMLYPCPFYLPAFAKRKFLCRERSIWMIYLNTVTLNTGFK